jgi:hypothetical protein
MNQKHLTLNFPLKSASDARLLLRLLPSLMQKMYQAGDAMGTIHYCCFTVLNEKTLLFFCYYDGEYDALLAGLAKNAGSVFDVIFKHVVNPPPTPTVENNRVFIQWTKFAVVHSLNIYSAYPEITVKKIQSFANQTAFIKKMNNDETISMRK